MKRIPLEYAIVAIAVAATAAVVAPARAQSAAADTDKVARGKYLVTTSGCHDCHTPWVLGPKGPEPDMMRALSGHPQDMMLPPPLLRSSRLIRVGLCDPNKAIVSVLFLQSPVLAGGCEPHA